MNLNKVVLVGRLTRDPILRQAEGGLDCSNFTLAVNRRFKRRDGAMEDEVAFVECAMFGPRARAFVEYHRERDHVCVAQGRLKTDRWMDEKNVERSKLVVVVEDWEFVDVGRQRGEA